MKSARKTSPTQLASEAAPPTIGFRLDEEPRRELGTRALKAGVSPHELARFYVIAALHDREELPALRGAILELERQAAELRVDLALATEMILATINPEHAKTVTQWVNENLRRP